MVALASMSGNGIPLTLHNDNTRISGRVAIQPVKIYAVPKEIEGVKLTSPDHRPSLYEKRWLQIYLTSFRGRRIYHDRGLYMESDGERYDWMPDKLAGNFSEWKDYRDMETTGFVQKELRPLVDKLIARSCVGRQAIEIHAERTIGWASSIHIDKLDPETRRSLNLIELGKHKVRAYIVTNKEFLAPRTHLVQMNIQIKPNDEAPGWICLIHNVYPGPYLGEFEEGRHITNELGLVTLHWSQQGAGKD